jgi:hypothetical protein
LRRKLTRRASEDSDLAWLSIVGDGSGDNPVLNMDNFQKKQAETKHKAADDTVDARIPETFQWLLVPGQPDPKGDVAWTEIKLSGADGLAARVTKKLKTEELLMVQLGGIRLRHELDRVPLWRGDHVGVKQFVEDMARYLYLPRLRDEDVLLAAIRDGVALPSWQADTFACAESHDEARKRYKGLRDGAAARVLVDGQSLLVKPDVAAAQLAAEAQPVPGTDGGATGTGGGGAPRAEWRPATGAGTDTPISPVPPKLGRFHGSVRIDPVRLGRDASRIAEEVVQHLSGIVDATVEITLEIQAELPDGAAEKLVRDVTENCRTLRFTSFGFEET